MQIVDSPNVGQLRNGSPQKLEASTVSEAAGRTSLQLSSSSEGAFLAGGPRRRRKTAIDDFASSTDLSFQCPSRDFHGFKQTPAFVGAAGAATLMNPDGTYRHAIRHKGPVQPSEGRTSEETSEASGRAKTMLARAHSKGSVRPVMFEVNDADEPTLPVPAAEHGPMQRHNPMAAGCKSQRYLQQPEFMNAAGMPSDGHYFSSSTDLARRIRPIIKKVGSSSRTNMKAVLFADEQAEPSPHAEDAPPEGVFACAAGCSSDAIQKASQLPSTIRPKLGARSKPGSGSHVASELPLAAGESTSSMGRHSFASRLERRQTDDEGDQPLPFVGAVSKRNTEPPTTLFGSQLAASPHGEAEARAARGQTRSTESCRHDRRVAYDSSAVSAALHGFSEPPEQLASVQRDDGIAGKPSRAINDEVHRTGSTPSRRGGAHASAVVSRPAWIEADESTADSAHTRVSRRRSFAASPLAKLSTLQLGDERLGEADCRAAERPASAGSRPKPAAESSASRFCPARLRHEFESAIEQRQKARGIAATSPFGVDTSEVRYVTSTQAAFEGGLLPSRDARKVETSSMASRMAHRRLERRSASTLSSDSCCNGSIQDGGSSCHTFCRATE